MTSVQEECDIHLHSKGVPLAYWQLCLPPSGINRRTSQRLKGRQGVVPGEPAGFIFSMRLVFSIPSVTINPSLSPSLSSQRGSGVTTAPPCSYMNSLDALRKLCPLVSWDADGLAWVWSSSVSINGAGPPSPWVAKPVGVVMHLVADWTVSVFCWRGNTR